MPSFIVHSISGRYISDYLQLNEADKEEFFISNLLPDTTNLEINPNWDELERRHQIQHEKETTHFRSNYKETLEYPDLEKFLKKYKEECSINISSFAYFFHLYTDYYFFKYFLPKNITFLDINKNKEILKEKTIYVKVNKTGIMMKKQDFFSKTKKEGIYQEYTRLNKYLLKKYNFSCDCNYLLKFLDNNKLKTNIEEINSNNGKQVVNKLNKLLKQTDECKDNVLQVFNEVEIDRFIKEVVETFKNKYSDIINNYKGGK